MPYLHLTCPDMPLEQRRKIAQRLTDETVNLFFNPRGGPSREQLRERTTVHFVPFADGELFIGARTPVDRGATDLTLEVSDWNMSMRQQARVAAALTPVLAELFEVPDAQRDGINLRFHSYPPTDFSVGGVPLSERVSWIAQVMKRLVG